MTIFYLGTYSKTLCQNTAPTMVTENPALHIITNTGFFEDYVLIDKVMEVLDLRTSLNFSFLYQMAS